VGIPGISNERNIMKEYYDESRCVGDGVCIEGYAYAYTYPGMTHVLQAAGRVIRRDEDCGVVVLVDDRYTAEPYLHLYPDHWEQISATGAPSSLYAYLSSFWESMDEDAGQ
jgi:Rad3-related DNA helicase